MSQTRIKDLRQRQQRAWDEANAIVQGADAMCRDLNPTESATFQAKTEEFNRLGAELRKLENAESGGRDPHQALAELAEIRYGPKGPDMHLEILRIQERLGARMVDALTAQMRDRELVDIAMTALREEREADRRRVLEHQRRMAQLTDALDGPLAVERNEAQQRREN